MNKLMVIIPALLMSFSFAGLRAEDDDRAVRITAKYVEKSIGNIQEYLQKVKEGIEEWGSVMLTAPLITDDPNSAFTFDLADVKAKNFYDDARANVQGQAAVFSQSFTGLQFNAQVQADLTASQFFQNQVNRNSFAQNISDQAARSKFQAALDAADRNPDPAARQQQIAAANATLAADLKNNTAQLPPQPGLPSLDPTFGTNQLQKPGDVLVEGGKFKEAFALFDKLNSKESVVISDRSALVTAAGDAATKAIFSLLGKPNDALKFGQGNKTYFAVTMVSVDPGWRTGKLYAADVTMQARVEYQYKLKTTDESGQELANVVEAAALDLDSTVSCDKLNIDCENVAPSEYEAVAVEIEATKLRIELTNELISAAEVREKAADKNSDKYKKEQDFILKRMEALSDSRIHLIESQIKLSKLKASNDKAIAKAKSSEANAAATAEKTKKFKAAYSDLRSRYLLATTYLKDHPNYLNVYEHKRLKETLKDWYRVLDKNKSLLADSRTVESFSSPMEDQTLNKMRRMTSDIIVAAVNPMTDVQALDLGNSIRRQSQFMFGLAAALQKSGAKAQAAAMFQHLRSLQEDVRTIATDATINAYGAFNGMFGVQVGPHLRALENIGRDKLKPADMLTRTSFPLLLIVGLNEHLDPCTNFDEGQNPGEPPPPPSLFDFKPLTVNVRQSTDWLPLDVGWAKRLIGTPVGTRWWLTDHPKQLREKNVAEWSIKLDKAEAEIDYLLTCVSQCDSQSHFFERTLNLMKQRCHVFRSKAVGSEITMNIEIPSQAAPPPSKFLMPTIVRANSIYIESLNQFEVQLIGSNLGALDWTKVAVDYAVGSFTFSNLTPTDAKGNITGGVIGMLALTTLPPDRAVILRVPLTAPAIKAGNFVDANPFVISPPIKIIAYKFLSDAPVTIERRYEKNGIHGMDSVTYPLLTNPDLVRAEILKECCPDKPIVGKDVNVNICAPCAKIPDATSLPVTPPPIGVVVPVPVQVIVPPPTIVPKP